ncbi:hypothetical protein ABID65_003172 [Bradyrhizobium sp. S3.9.2]|uniref:hypothetical protein n=1 Tax=Bradyrhizobium sp. S3.9.2 TaxID=3156432 RepID=UPI003397426C
MRELFDIIRSNPWPFGAGLFVVILMIIAENFGRGIQGDGAVSDFDGAVSDFDGAVSDFSDADGGDGGCCGDGGGGD